MELCVEEALSKSNTSGFFETHMDILSKTNDGQPDSRSYRLQEQFKCDIFGSRYHPQLSDLGTITIKLNLNMRTFHCLPHKFVPHTFRTGFINCHRVLQFGN